MNLRLSANNTPAASVVIEADSPPALSFAARELSRYLAIITGGRFPVVEGKGVGRQLNLHRGPLPPAINDIAFPPPPGPANGAGQAGEGGERQTGWKPVLQTTDGTTQDGTGAGLSNDAAGAYGWRVHESGIEIVGERPGAVLHAVYALLERLGCRWLHPRDGGEIIPRTPEVALPFGEHVAEPAMPMRELTNLYAIDREYPLHIDWMAKNRFNRFMTFLNIEGSFGAYEALIAPELAARDMDATLGHHSFRFLLPPEEHFADHSDWYALLDGERSPDGQLCTSNPEVAERVAERICGLFEAHPQVEMFGLWPNDGFGWCECEGCAKLEEQRPSQFWSEYPRRTDTYLQFVNAVAALVAEERPDRRLSALAYVNYADAPERVRPAETVAVCYAAFHRCLKHPLRPDVDCDRMNAAYAREFERWREMTADDLYLFCYLSQIHTMSLPYPLHGMLPENWQWLADAGCDGFTMEFVPEEWGAFGTNLYEMARLAWDPEMDLEAWLDGHREAIYGPAAGHMRAYWRELRDVLVAGGPCTGHYDLTWTTRATERMLAAALEAMGHARAAAATGEKRHWQAVEQAWVGQELLLRMGQWQRLLRDDLPERAAAAKQDLLAFAREQADSGAVDVRRYERVLG